MHGVNYWLKDEMSRLQTPPWRLEAIRRSRSAILDKLHDYGYFHVPAGSYFRSVVSDIDDLDFLLVLPLRPWARVCRAPNIFSVLVNGIEFSSLKALGQLLGDSRKVSESMGHARAPRWTNPSITCYVKSLDLSYDFLPALRCTEDKVFLIPAGDRSGTWKLTSPLQQAKDIREMEFQHPGLRNVIRCLKFLRDELGWGIESYALERVAIQVCTSGHWKDGGASFADNLCACLELCVACLQGIADVVHPLDGTSMFSHCTEPMHTAEAVESVLTNLRHSIERHD